MADTRLQRSSKGILGGVCAGMAEYFAVDPLVIRIIAILGTLVTGGVLALVYLVLLFILPKTSAPHDMVDIQPQSAVSDRYGSLDCSYLRGRRCGRSATNARNAFSGGSNPFSGGSNKKNANQKNANAHNSKNPKSTNAKGAALKDPNSTAAYVSSAVYTTQRECDYVSVGHMPPTPPLGYKSE